MDNRVGISLWPEKINKKHSIIHLLALPHYFVKICSQWQREYLHKTRRGYKILRAGKFMTQMTMSTSVYFFMRY